MSLSRRSLLKAVAAAVAVAAMPGVVKAFANPRTLVVPAGETVYLTASGDYDTIEVFGTLICRCDHDGAAINSLTIHDGANVTMDTDVRLIRMMKCNAV